MKEYSCWRSNEDNTDAEYFWKTERDELRLGCSVSFSESMSQSQKNAADTPTVLKIKFGMMISVRVRGRKRQKYHVQKDGISAPEVQIDNLIIRKISKQKNIIHYFGLFDLSWLLQVARQSIKILCLIILPRVISTRDFFVCRSLTSPGGKVRFASCDAFDCREKDSSSSKGENKAYIPDINKRTLVPVSLYKQGRIPSITASCTTTHRLVQCYHRRQPS